MVVKHPISADVDPGKPLFQDIYGFECLPIFHAEIATFRNGAPMIFPKCSRKFQNIISAIVVNRTKIHACQHILRWYLMIINL